MEQKVLDQINVVMKSLNEQIELYNRRKEMFFGEFFTDEMKEIIKSVIRSTGMKIVFKLDDKWNMAIDASSYVDFYPEANPINTYTFYMGNVSINNENLSQKDVVKLQRHAEEFKKKERMFNLFVDRAEEIICNIVCEYRSINEDCMDRLNGIMDMLGEDVEDVKHIKITVEWI